MSEDAVSEADPLTAQQVQFPAMAPDIVGQKPALLALFNSLTHKIHQHNAISSIFSTKFGVVCQAAVGTQTSSRARLPGFKS